MTAQETQHLDYKWAGGGVRGGGGFLGNPESGIYEDSELECGHGWDLGSHGTGQYWSREVLAHEPVQQ